MNTTILNPTVNYGDLFAICLRLCNLAGLYDHYTLLIHKDESNVTFLPCSHLELISRLSSLDYSNLLYLEVYGRTNGADLTTDYTLLFEICHRYRVQESNEFCFWFYNF